MKLQSDCGCVRHRSLCPAWNSLGSRVELAPARIATLRGTFASTKPAGALDRGAALEAVYLGPRADVAFPALVERVYRSVASRGHLGGLSVSIHRIVDVMDAAGRDIVIV